MSPKIKIPYCKKCPRIKFLEEWVIPTTDIKRHIQESRIEHRVIGYVQTICPLCKNEGGSN